MTYRNIYKRIYIYQRMVCPSPNATALELPKEWIEKNHMEKYKDQVKRDLNLLKWYVTFMALFVIFAIIAIMSIVK